MWTLLPAPAQDRQWLTDHPLRGKILAACVELKDDPYMGEPLKALRTHQVHKASLEGCRVVKIASPSYDDDLRIVYRLHEDKHEIEVIAIGPRQGSVVYRTAIERLNPRPVRPRWARLGRQR